MAERNKKGQFGKGNGFAKGRKKGTQFQYSKYREMASSYIPSIIKQLCEMAVGGDIQAAKVVLDRSWPAAALEIAEMELMIDDLIDQIEELKAESSS
jgi:hypothetical protein